MKIIILLVAFIILLSGCRDREPMNATSKEISDQPRPDEMVTYTGNAFIKRTNGDPCKYAMIYLQNTYHEHKRYFYADTKGFVCLKYYKAKPDQGDPQEYIATPCIVYMNQFDKSISLQETIEVKLGDACIDDGLNPLVIVFTDSLDM